jgi:HSP20 family protein
MAKKETALATTGAKRDPFGILRQMTAEFDRFFEEPFGVAFRWPSVRALGAPESTGWLPSVDVFEKDNRLVTKVDLPGMKKEDVHVEVTDGQLAISGERKSETEDKKENVYRSERSFGSFYRSVPLPEGIKLEDIKATFANGVLEVSVPLPAKAAAKPLSVPINEPAKEPKAA